MAKEVLVVGDWVVDEHWVVGRERSTTASRRGEYHYHALHGPKSSVEALCGAGLVASLLCEVTEDGKTPHFRVHGLGAWHKEDRIELEKMIVRGGLDGHNHYRLRRGNPLSVPQNATVSLHNIHESRDLGVGTTTKMLRVYLRDGEKVRLIQRIDWEEPPPRDVKSGRSCWIHNESDIDWKGELGSIRPEVIIIKDLVKGVVSPVLVEQLVKHYSECKPRWYISSKEWHLNKVEKDRWEASGDSWLNVLRSSRQDVRLFLVPQVAAQAAISEAHRDINAWRIASGHPSWHAMMLMDALAAAARGGKSDPLVVVLPEAFHVLARAPEAEGNMSLMAHAGGQEDSFEIGVPAASVLFSALVALMENPTSKINDAATALSNAISYTRDWMKCESNRIRDPRDWQPTKHSALDVQRQSDSTGMSHKPVPWYPSLSEWTSARQGDGTVKHGERNHIELWRAMTDVDGYICLVDRKREAIRKIKRQLASFKESSGGRHLSIMLISDPGSGKTFLLDKLANEAGMELMSFNITQMITATDILDCFDAIVSQQSSGATSKHILVFFDEINAHLAGQPVYSAFLDPIERGTYRRAGKTFFIRPCVWVFAGTAIKEDSPESKGSDFKSRLTLAPLDFGTDPKDALAGLERRYVGAALLQRNFPDVHTASDLVLRSFGLLYDGASLRELERFVREFRNIRQGKVWASNVPENWIKSSWQNAEILLRRKESGEEGKKLLEEFKTNYESFNTRFDEWKREASKLNETEIEIIPSSRDTR